MPRNTVVPNGRKISELRNLKDPPWTQEALAFHSRVPHRTVAHVESGRNTRSGTLARIAKALGVSEENLIIRAASPQQKDPVENTAVKREFEEFFGEGATTRANTASIILQSDSIEELLKGLVEDLAGKIKVHPEHRLFKARTWVPRWDADGARAVREAFQKAGFKAPEILLSDRHGEESIEAFAPFTISMGLGFTEKTKNEMEAVCGAWLEIDTGPHGDAISLNKELVKKLAKLDRPENETVDDPRTFISRFELVDDPKNTKSWRFLPIDNNKEYREGESYLDRWLRMEPNKKTERDTARDYAMIFRHTSKLLKPERRHVFIGLAGFTERGTAIAGRYLANNLELLYDAHVKGQTATESMGDFLILIEGPSWPTRVGEWREDPHFEAITPDKVRKCGFEWRRGNS